MASGIPATFAVFLIRIRFQWNHPLQLRFTCRQFNILTDGIFITLVTLSINGRPFTLLRPSHNLVSKRIAYSWSLPRPCLSVDGHYLIILPSSSPWTSWSHTSRSYLERVVHIHGLPPTPATPVAAFLTKFKQLLAGFCCTHAWSYYVTFD